MLNGNLVSKYIVLNGVNCLKVHFSILSTVFAGSLGPTNLRKLLADWIVRVCSEVQNVVHLRRLCLT